MKRRFMVFKLLAFVILFTAFMGNGGLISGPLKVDAAPSTISKTPQELLIGKWKAGDGTILQLNKDGTGIIDKTKFTYLTMRNPDNKNSIEVMCEVDDGNISWTSTFTDNNTMIFEVTVDNETQKEKLTRVVASTQSSSAKPVSFTFKEMNSLIIGKWASKDGKVYEFSKDGMGGDNFTQSQGSEISYGVGFRYSIESISKSKNSIKVKTSNAIDDLTHIIVFKNKNSITIDKETYNRVTK